MANKTIILIFILMIFGLSVLIQVTLELVFAFIVALVAYVLNIL